MRDRGFEREETPGRLERGCVGLVRGILAAILLVLALISAAATCRVYGGAEIVQYEGDFLWVHLMVLAGAVGMAAYVCLRKERQAFSGSPAFRQRKTADRYTRILIVLALFYLLWLLATLVWAGSDSRLSMESARRLLRGDFSPWDRIPFMYHSSKEASGYAFTYPSQNGLILYMAVFWFFFRNAAPYVMQAANIGFLFLGVFCLSRLMDGLWGKGEDSRKKMAVCLAGYLPFSFYFLFVYGTMPGFGLSALSVWLVYRYAKTERRRDLYLGSAALTAAAVLKSNYLIVMVALVLFLLAESLFRRRWRLSAAAVFLLFVYLAGNRGISMGLERITGRDVSGGIPMTAWVEMGLQEGKRGPGWYNGYHVRTFQACGGDAEQTKERVRADLEETLAAMAADPGGTADFFLRKVESMWAEPTFQSLWIQEVGGGSWILPQASDSLCKEGGLLNNLFVAAANVLQTLIYGGAFLWTVLAGRRVRLGQLLPGIIFIGGFLFHLFWEAKGQYTAVYFVLLIPYAGAGIRLAGRAVLQRVHPLRRFMEDRFPMPFRD